MTAPRFPVGTRYTPYRGYVCTVTDILTTTDSSGAVVRIRYVAVHEFAGQMVADYDVTDTAIARGNPALPADPLAAARDYAARNTDAFDAV